MSCLKSKTATCALLLIVGAFITSCGSSNTTTVVLAPDPSVSYSITAQMNPGDVKVNGSVTVNANATLTVPSTLLVTQGIAEPDGIAILWLQGTPGSGDYCQYRIASGGTYTLRLGTSVGCSTSISVSAGTTLTFEFQTGYFTYPETPPQSVILSITLSGQKS